MKHCRWVVSASSLAAAAALAFAAATSPSVPTVQAQALPQMDQAHMKALYSEKCVACHDLTGKYDPLVNGYSPQEWRRTVNRMMRKPNSNISASDAGYIIDYLSMIAPKNTGRGPADPWATNAEDVWTVPPTVTRIFNFEQGNALTALAPVEDGTGGPAAQWHTVAGTTPDGTVMKETPVKPNPARFALLVDKQDTGRNLDVKVRFQIQKGTVSPSVGIAFGLQNSKSYNVLRFDALHNTLSLLKIDEPTHTTIQTTAVDQPVVASPGTLPAVSITPPATKTTGPGWHTLRLLVNNGQIRGWVDMQKRISTQDPSYTGGKVGLWTQGDTVAVFDDWIVDLYNTAPDAAAPAQ